MSLDPDTDDDGLLDGTEVDVAEGSGCPDPADADSDGDTLLDGGEVTLGTDPCSPDTDSDGVPDNIDPSPTDPGVPPGFIEQDLRTLCVSIQGLDLSLVAAKNSNAARGRRNSMCNKVNAAANATAAGDYQGAIEQLNSLFAKLDGQAQPGRWMVDSAERDGIVAVLVGDIALLLLLV